MKLLLSVCVVVCTAGSLFAAQKIDGIAAVIGDSVILRSEVEALALMRLGNTQEKPDSTGFALLEKSVLSDMIDGKVLLVRAAKDTTIKVTDAEIDDALNRQIKGYMAQGNFSQAQLEEEIQKSTGMNFSQFKTQLRKNFREQLYRQKAIQQYGAVSRVSRKEVEDFYHEFKDSIPPAGKSYRLSKLSLTVGASDSIKQAAYKKILVVRDRLDRGDDFAEVAKTFSEDPSSASGGDLGFIAKGTLGELTFEERVFGLKVGQHSPVFETRIGFHIVKVEEKRDQTVRVRQIVTRIEPRQADIAQVHAKLDSLRLVCTSTELFGKAVDSLSSDAFSKLRHGDLGWKDQYAMNITLREALDSAQVGFTTKVLVEGDVYSIYRVEKIDENRAYTLDNDFDLLTEKAKEVLGQKKVASLVDKWRKDIFIDIRL